MNENALIWCLGQALSDTRMIQAVERRQTERLLTANLIRLWASRAFCYGDLLLMTVSFFAIKQGYPLGTTGLALSIMPGVFGLAVGGMAIRPAHQMVVKLRKDLAINRVQVFGDEEVVRLPESGVGLAIYGRPSLIGLSLSVAANPSGRSSESYPHRLEWRADRRRFAQCRSLTSAELNELSALRARIASRHLGPALGFFGFSSLTIIALSNFKELADPLVPIAVLGAGAWFVWQLLHDLYVATKMSRESAVISDLVRDGAYELSVEVLPTASLVWTIDRTPAGWRY